MTIGQLSKIPMKYSKTVTGQLVALVISSPRTAGQLVAKTRHQNEKLISADHTKYQMAPNIIIMISSSYFYIANDRVSTHQEYLLHPSMTVIVNSLLIAIS